MNDLLAVLLYNRAVGLLIVGACQAAADDCLISLDFVSDQVRTLSSEGGPVWRPKLYNRMARALIKLGKVNSEQAFKQAIDHANIALYFVSKSPESLTRFGCLAGITTLILNGYTFDTFKGSIKEHGLIGVAVIESHIQSIHCRCLVLPVQYR